MDDEDAVAKPRTPPTTVDGQELVAGRSYEILLTRGDAQRPAIIQVVKTSRAASGDKATLRVLRYIRASEFFRSLPSQKTINEIILLHQEVDSEDGTVRREVVEGLSSESIHKVLAEVTIEYPESFSDSVTRPRKKSGRRRLVCHWTMAAEGLQNPGATFFHLPPGTDWVDVLEQSAHPEAYGLPTPQIYDRPSTLDLFSGTGGSSRGFVDAGFDSLGGVERNSHAATGFEVRSWTVIDSH